MNLFVAGFIGSPKMNFMAGIVTEQHGKQVRVDIGSGNLLTVGIGEDTNVAPGTKVTLGVRPEHLEGAATEGSRVEGQVVAVEHLGSEAYVHLSLDGASGKEPLVFKSTGDTRLQTGQTSSVTVPPQACYLFDEHGVAFARAREG